MNSTKSKDRARQYDQRKMSRNSNNKFFYDISQHNTNKRSTQKIKKHTKQENDLEIEQKQNNQIFRNIQKCNQKMEYYKLMGSLQQQKRTMLEQQNKILRKQNEQLKQEVLSCQKQIKKLSKKLEKAIKQLQNYSYNNLQKQYNSHKQNNYFIELPNRSNKNSSKTKKSSPHYEPQQQQQSVCQKCFYLQQKLQEQRQLYEKDRNYLKQQINNISQMLDDIKKHNKLLNKQLQGKGSFNDKKQIQILEKFKLKQNQLKKQLTSCYKAFQQKCNLISQLESSIDYFQQENQRILKLLTLFDTQNYQSKFQKKPLNIQIPRQQRAKSSYNVKNKSFMYSSSNNQNQPHLKEFQQNIIQNRRGNRKCGSIKKIQVQ